MRAAQQLGFGLAINECSISGGEEHRSTGDRLWGSFWRSSISECDKSKNKNQNIAGPNERWADYIYSIQLLEIALQK